MIVRERDESYNSHHRMMVLGLASDPDNLQKVLQSLS